MQLLQQDLAYWLARAHQQGYAETWLLYAKVYKNKQLQLPEGITVKSCFNHALKNDDEGEVAYQYGMHLLQVTEHTRGLNLLEQAAEKENMARLTVIK